MKRAVVHRRVYHKGGRAFAAALAVLVLTAFGAAGQLDTPLQIAANEPIMDEFGVTLRGHANAIPANRDLVQVLWASNSVIYPPAYDGTPDPRNPPAQNGAWWIGSLTSPDLANPGFFSAVLANPRPDQSRTLFVRAFNADKAKSATFYGDSQILSVHDNDVLMAKIGATTNALDPRDNDNDGLNNSWEKSLGADPNNPDSDGDGMNDGDERRARTGILDSNSVFVVAWLQRGSDEDAVVSWESVTGVQYQVEFTDNNLDSEGVFSNVSDVVTAADVVTSVLIPYGLQSERGIYRVRLVEP